MSQWLYRIVPVRAAAPGEPTHQESALARAHDRYVIELRERRILILAGSGPAGDSTLGIAIFEAPDAAAANAIAAADPALAGGSFTATVHPYRVAAARDGIVD